MPRVALAQRPVSRRPLAQSSGSFSRNRPRPVRRRLRALTALALACGASLLEAFAPGDALPGFFEATWSAGTSYYKSAWWGWISPASDYNPSAGGWIYHQEHGWLYVGPVQGSGVWARDGGGLGWLYFDRESYRSGNWTYTAAFDDYLVYLRGTDRWFYSDRKDRWFLAPRNVVDSDQDGMNDALERYHFDHLIQSGQGDYDRDGSTNAQELAGGSSPLMLPAPQLLQASNSNSDPYIAPFVPAVANPIPGMRTVATVTRLLPLDLEESPDPSSRSPRLSELTFPDNGTFLLKTRFIDPSGRAMPSPVVRTVYRVRLPGESMPLYAGVLLDGSFNQTVVVWVLDRLRKDKPRASLGRGWLVSRVGPYGNNQDLVEPDYREAPAEVYALDGDIAHVGLDREGLLGSRKRHLLCKGWIATQPGAWLHFLITPDPAASANWTLAYDPSRIFFPNDLSSLTCGFLTSNGVPSGLSGNTLELGSGRLAGRMLVGMAYDAQSKPTFYDPWLLQPLGLAGDVFLGKPLSKSTVSEYALARSSQGLSSPVCIGTGWVLRPGPAITDVTFPDALAARTSVPNLAVGKAYFFGFSGVAQGFVTDRSLVFEGQTCLDLGAGSITNFRDFRPASDVSPRAIYRANQARYRFAYTYDAAQSDGQAQSLLGYGAIHVVNGLVNVALQTRKSYGVAPDGQVDSDGDGVTDFDEVRWGTNPNARNTDGDQYDDYAMSALGHYLDRAPAVWQDPVDDDDGDGLSNLVEWGLGSDCSVADSDGDGHADFREFQLGSDLLDAASLPSESTGPSDVGRYMFRIQSQSSHSEKIADDNWRCSLYRLERPGEAGVCQRTSTLYHPGSLIWDIGLSPQSAYRLEIIKPTTCAFVFGSLEACDVGGIFSLSTPRNRTLELDLLRDINLAEAYWIPSSPDGTFLHLNYREAAATLVRGGVRTCLEIQPGFAGIAMDNNQDGRIDGADATSSESPMRLWLNNDRDEGHAVDDGDWEEDDIRVTDANGPETDCGDEVIESERDLEDFHRLVLSLQGRNLDELANGNHRLGLRWVVSSGSPSIRCYPQVGTGQEYLNNSLIAREQMNSLPQYWEVGGNFSSRIEGPGVHMLAIEQQQQWLASLASGDMCQLSLLVEGYRSGRGRLQLGLVDPNTKAFMPVSELHLELKPISQFYERWSVGDANGGEPQAQASLPPWSYPKGAREEPTYILFVHGWNMAAWEKDAYAATAFKRLYWQGYRGRFGVFCWPTTNGFGTTLEDNNMLKSKAATAIGVAADVTNYDRGEWTAWRSGAPLLGLLKQLRAQYPGSVYLLAHSMGNVVASEALRLGAVANEGKLVECYVASQAAVPAHAYRAGGGVAMNAETLGLNFLSFFDGGWPQTPNIYGDWFGNIASTAPRRINFYNVNDYALWRDIWEVNQYLKPDLADTSNGQPCDYGYEGSSASQYGTIEDKFRYRTDTTAYRGRFTIQGYATTFMKLGTLADRYRIMAFAAESRSNAAGAAVDRLGMGDAISLPTIWPADSSGDTRKYSRHKWHSAQFRSSNALQKGYWTLLLGDKAFNVKR